MRVPLKLQNADSPPVPEGKNTIFAWPTFEVGPQQPTTLVLTEPAPDISTDGRLWLELSVGLDLRELYEVEVQAVPRSGVGKPAGTFDIRYGYTLQPFRLELSLESLEALRKGSFRLQKSRGTGPLQFIRTSSAWHRWPTEADGSRTWGPCLLVDSSADLVRPPNERLSDLLRSVLGLQPFGWMDGCVLDGIWALLPEPERQEVVAGHLGAFTDDRGQLTYQDARSRHRRNEYAGIEYTLPAAAFARLDSQCPAVAAAVDFWINRRDSEDLVTDPEFVSAEGCYTLAYPMALVGTLIKRKDLVDLAVRQLETRWTLLHSTDGLKLRFSTHSIEEYRGWARAYAWFMLGLAYTLPLVGELRSTKTLPTMLEKLAEESLKAQDSSTGLYSCFLQESLPPDTSGSAGIAAALALSTRTGVLSADYRGAAERTAAGLKEHISVDGMLTGVAQSNRGGEALQRSNYRVCSQMGSGLAAQLFGFLA